jgi:LysM repeat protein
MNNPSPFIPQGSFVEQKNKGRARVKIAVFFVLAVHGVGLLALLMQGCRRDDKDSAAGDPSTNMADAAAPFTPTNAAVDTNIAVAPSNPTPTLDVINTAAPPSNAGPTDYVIVKGDNYSTLALKFKVSARAIADANPGVDPNKLQISQKIRIPAPTPTPTGVSTTGNATVPAVGANGEQIYSVVNGDTLSSIATKKHTTVRALRSANDLKTDAIKVGQKLKIPGKSEAAPGAATPPASGAR